MKLVSNSVIPSWMAKLILGTIITLLLGTGVSATSNWVGRVNATASTTATRVAALEGQLHPDDHDRLVRIEQTVGDLDRYLRKGNRYSYRPPRVVYRTAPHDDGHVDRVGVLNGDLSKENE